MNHRSRGYLYWFLTISVIVALLGLAALRIYIISSPPDAPSEAVAVYGVEVKSGSVVSGPDYIGTIEPRMRSLISSRVQAQIDNIFVNEGDKVEKNALLAQLDDRELQKGNEVARAKEQAVREELSALKTQAQAARADKNYAKNELQRYRTLFEKGLAARSQFEKIESNYKRARENLNGLEAQIKRLKSEIEAAGSEKARARLVSEYAKIKAPFPGIVDYVHVEEGELASPSRPLFTLATTEKYKLVFYFPQEDAAKVKENNPVNLNFSSTDRQYATISQVFPALSEQAMGRAEIKLNQLPEEIKTGHNLLVRVISQKASSVSTIPESTIIRTDGETYVYIIENNILHLQKIETTISDGHFTAVIEGLKPGQILADGAFLELQRHFDGQPAIIYNKEDLP